MLTGFREESRSTVALCDDAGSPLKSADLCQRSEPSLPESLLFQSVNSTCLAYIGTSLVHSATIGS